MEDALRAKLDGLLQFEQASRQQAQVDADRSAEKRAARAASFQRLSNEIIQPAMKDVAGFVSGRGWTCDVEDRGETKNSHGGTTEPRVILTLFRGKPQTYDKHKHPHFMVFFDKDTGEIKTYSTTIGPNSGGSGGPGLVFSENSMIFEALQIEIVKFLERLIKGEYIPR